MRFAKTINTSIALGFIMVSAHSAAALDISGKARSHSHKGHFKPGAAVSLSYDYDGDTQPGEIENMTLTLSHYYNDGYITARLLETPDLEIIPHKILENEKLQSGLNLQFPLQLSGTKTGEHYISLEVIYENLFGEQSLRILSLPIQIGNIDKSKGAATAPESSKLSKEKGFVVFSAQEIIK